MMDFKEILYKGLQVFDKKSSVGVVKSETMWNQE